MELDEDVLDDELWADEHQVKLGDVPEALWSHAPLDKPPIAPEPWVDQLADDVEINRLLSELQPVGTTIGARRSTAVAWKSG